MFRYVCVKMAVLLDGRQIVCKEIQQLTVYTIVDFKGHGVFIVNK